MKKSEIEKLTNKRYTIKQAIAYFIETYVNVEDKLNFKEIMNKLILNLIKIDEKEIMEKIEVTDVEYFWSINVEQLISYAYIIFEKITNTKQEVEIRNIIEELKNAIKLYSPNNAEEFVENKMGNSTEENSGGVNG